MIPRKKLDISWTDLLVAIFRSAWPGNREATQRRIEELFCPGQPCLVSLSERSAFDVAVQAYNFPPGSEVLVSSLTVRPFPEILKAHNLVPIPIDLNMSDLSMRMDILERAVNERTRAIVCAQLLGSRIPLDEYVAFARRHNLVVFEDCAQAFTGDEFRGHPDADVTMFSFGPIKTCSALWGGITRFKDPVICEKARAIQDKQPVQTRWLMFFRALKYCVLHATTYRIPYTIINRLLRLLGAEHITDKSIRNFTGKNQFRKFRQRPSYPLLALLERRLKRFEPAAVQKRTANAELFTRLTPDLVRPAINAPYHTFWIYPVMAKDPKALIQYLWSKGFDSTVGPSSFLVASAEPGYEAFEPRVAKQAMSQVVYLAVHDRMTRREIERLAEVINACEYVYRRQPEQPVPLEEHSEAAELQSIAGGDAG